MTLGWFLKENFYFRIIILFLCPLRHVLASSFFILCFYSLEKILLHPSKKHLEISPRNSVKEALLPNQADYFFYLCRHYREFFTTLRQRFRWAAVVSLWNLPKNPRPELWCGERLEWSGVIPWRVHTVAVIRDLIRLVLIG